MVDGLDGLRHDAVVGGHHQHDDVGHLGAAGAHGGERLVTRRVDERNLAVVDLHDRRADVLRDAAGLACGDARVADGVEQRRLAVVDVAHDGDHGGPRLQVLVAVVVHHGVFLFGRHDAHLAPHVVGDELDQVVGHRLREREHLAQHEQPLDDVVGLHADGLGELGHRGTLGHLHHRVVQHEFGVEALLDGLHLQTLAVLGLALLLALLAAPLAFVGRGGGHCGAGLGEHLVALQLLGLHGHLGIAVLRRRLRRLQLGHRRHEGAALPGALLLFGAHALLGRLRTGAGLAGGLLGASGSSLLLLSLDALLLGLDLREQRVEVGGALGREHRRRPLVGGRGLAGLLRVALAQRLFHGLLLGHFGGGLGGPRPSAGLGLLALDALLFTLYLARQALVRRRGR